MKNPYLQLLPVLFLLAFSKVAALTYESIEFESDDGQIVSAQLGSLEVPSHHDDPTKTETIQLKFIRFPSTADDPGSPIVYLAGGPGGSGIATARGHRFALFMALRQYGDVIAFDQRGTGDSQLPGCKAEHALPLTDPFTSEVYVAYALDAARKCVEWWRQQGVDLDAYNTWESAGDLEALRKALGAEKLTLWGISYGTHLAMAAVKRMGDTRIDRLILASLEGLDQTVKLPARWDDYLARLSTLVAAEPGSSEAFPDITGTLRIVLERLEAKPVAVKVRPHGDESEIEISLGPLAVRYALSAMSNNPQSAASIPSMIYGMAGGEFEPLAEWIYQFAYARPVEFNAMSLAMDLASGISSDRLDLVNKQAETALIGKMLNFPMPHFIGGLDIKVLPNHFRAPLNSSVPALILTGTLDGRTFPDGHAEVLSQFSNGYQIVIENAGHDLLMASPAVSDAIETFMRGEVPTDTIKIPPPHFGTPQK